MNFGSSSFNSPDPAAADREFERFIEEENQKHRLQQTISELNDKCWELCVDKPGQRLDSRTETCLANCVNRFLDASTFIVKRLEKVGQQHSDNMELY